MAITGPVQEATGGTAAGTSFTITLGTPPDFGGTLLLGVGTNFGVSSVASSGTTWTLVQSSTAHVAAYIYAAYNVQPGAGSVITVTLSSSGKGAGNVSEWAGIAGFGLDQSGTANGSGTAIASASILPTSANEIVFHAVSWQGSAESNGPTGGLTALTKGTGGTLFSASAYQIQTTASSASTTYTIPSSGWDSVIASFFAQGVVAPTDTMVGISVTDGFASEHRPPWYSPQNRFGRLNSAGQPFAIAPSATALTAELTSGTGQAFDAATSVAASATAAAGAGSSPSAAIPSISASPTAASATGAASGLNESITVAAGVGAGAGTVGSSGRTIAPVVGASLATGSASNAATTSSNPSSVIGSSQTGTSSGSAFDAGPTIAVGPSLIAVTGSSFGAGILIAPAAGSTGGGAAFGASISVKPSAGAATASATTGAAVSPATSAGAATGTAIAGAPKTDQSASPGLASATGRALDVLTAGPPVFGGSPPSIAIVVTIRGPLEMQ